MKSLKIQAFSPDTEVMEQEQVIEMLDKLIMLNRGQIMLSKSENLITFCKRLLSILSCSSVFFNCMFSLIVLSILWMVTQSAVTHEQSSNNNLFNRITVHHGWDLNPQHLH